MEQKFRAKEQLRPTEITTVIDSAKLFGTLRKVKILHEDKLYQLTITRQNKLILTR